MISLLDFHDKLCSQLFSILFFDLISLKCCLQMVYNCSRQLALKYYYFLPLTHNYMSQAKEDPKALKTRLALPDLEAMKKAILTEISEVTKEDLNVMSAYEIEEFYKQLTGTMVEQSKKIVDHSSKEKDPEPEKANHSVQPTPQTSKKINQQKSVKQTQGTKQDQKIVLINGQEYYRPKFLDEKAYELTNNKLLITYGPELKSLQQKTRAVCSAYNPSMEHIVRAMKPQQIEDTYERLRMPENKKKLVVPTNMQIPISQFCLYIEPKLIDQDLSHLEQHKPILREKNKGSKPNIVENIKFKEVEQIQDQFFNQGASNSIKKEKPKQMKREIVKSVTPKPTTSLMNSVKKKEIIETSCQTESILQENMKTRTKITILNQIQYVEDTDEQQELRHEPRMRLFDNDDQVNRFPQKLNFEELRKALFQPGTQPQAQVLLWIQDMKNLVSEFEDNYLNQFKTNWTLIND